MVSIISLLEPPIITEYSILFKPPCVIILELFVDTIEDAFAPLIVLLPPLIIVEAKLSYILLVLKYPPTNTEPVDAPLIDPAV